MTQIVQCGNVSWAVRQCLEIAKCEYHMTRIESKLQRFSAAISWINASQNHSVAEESADELVVGVLILQDHFVLRVDVVQVFRSNQHEAHSAQSVDFIAIEGKRLANEECSRRDARSVQIVHVAN